HARVRDRDVDRSELGLGPSVEILDSRLIRDVAKGVHRRAAGRLDLGADAFETLLAAAGDGDARSGLAEDDRNRAPDALVRAGDDRNAAVQVELRDHE